METNSMNRSAKPRTAASIAATAVAAAVVLVGCTATADTAQGSSPEVHGIDPRAYDTQTLPPIFTGYPCSGGWEQLFFAGR
jgi:hypothetical protein